MKMANASLSVLALCLALSAMTQGQQIYTNGPINGTVDAWGVFLGAVVSDSFTLGEASTVNGLSFGAWMFPDLNLISAEISITSTEFGGTTYFDGVVNFTQSDCIVNQYGFNVCTESAAFNGPQLDAGTYWLDIQNANTLVYWDENSGPSLASTNSVGTIPSEAFTLYGGTSTGTTPEPRSIMLLGSGILGLIGVRLRAVLEACPRDRCKEPTGRTTVLGLSRVVIDGPTVATSPYHK